MTGRQSWRSERDPVWGVAVGGGGGGWDIVRENRRSTLFISPCSSGQTNVRVCAGAAGRNTHKSGWHMISPRREKRASQTRAGKCGRNLVGIQELASTWQQLLVSNSEARFFGSRLKINVPRQKRPNKYSQWSCEFKFWSYLFFISRRVDISS